MTRPVWWPSAQLALAAAFALLPPGAGAAWFSVCDDAAVPLGATVFSSMLRPDGGSESLMAADHPRPDCRGVELPVAPRRVRWAQLITRETAAGLAGGVILKGTEDGARLIVNEVIALAEPVARGGTLPVGDDLLPALRATAFGGDRATVRVLDTRVVLECGPGQSAAGVVLAAAQAALPAGPTLALQLGFSARGEFAVTGSGVGGGRKVGASPARHTQARIDLAPAPVGESTASWVFACPDHAARLEIRSVHLKPRHAKATAPARALWVWRPEAWAAQPDDLFALLAANGADTVFVTVPVTADRKRVAEPGALEKFITRATARGVAVWALAGDPRAVLPAERAGYVERALAYADYNRGAPAAARLSGLQLDIEPYLNAGYHIDAESWLSAYLETLALVKPAVAMPLDVAIPFWWASQSYRGGRFLDHLAPLVDVVTVMNYRTDRRQILEFAEPFLAWAARANRRVRIGLEAGPIRDESLRVFRSRQEGELWLAPLGEHALLVLLDAPAANPAGAAFAYSHTTRWRASSITFRQHIGALRKLLPGFEQVWRAWPAFAGVALHGLDAD